MTAMMPEMMPSEAPTEQVPIDPATGGTIAPEGEAAPIEEPEDPEEPEEDELEESPPDSSGVARELAVNAAVSQLGIPSVVGGGNENGPTVSPGEDPEKNEAGFDSPGLVGYCLAQAGIDSPESAEDQSQMGPRILVSECLPGDLVYFEQTEDIAILVEEGVMIQAPDAGGAVEEEEVDDLDEAWGVSLEEYYRN